MLNSKLIDIISTLNKREMKILSKFIYSPVYNQHKDVIALFEYIQTLGGCTEANLDKKTVYSCIFPKSQYDDLRLRHVVSYLLRVCENCLVYMEQSTNDLLYPLYLLKAYKRRALDKHFANDFLLHKKQNGPKEKRCLQSHLYLSKINELACDTGIKPEKEAILHLLKADEELTTFFVLTKLKNAAKLFASKPEVKVTDILLLPEIEQIIQQHQLLHNTEIATYYWAFKCMQDPGDTRYYKLFKECLAKHSHQMEVDDLKDLFALSINYCKEKLAQQNQEFERELFEIYLHGLASEVLLNNQVLSFETQKSIVDIALKLGEVNWLKDFIEDTRQITDKKLRDELYQLNLAKLQFYRSDFTACIASLSIELGKNLQILQEAQLLKIRALHELGEHNQLKLETKKLKEINSKLKV